MSDAPKRHSTRERRPPKFRQMVVGCILYRTLSLDSIVRVGQWSRRYPLPLSRKTSAMANKAINWLNYWLSSSPVQTKVHISSFRAEGYPTGG